MVSLEERCEEQGFARQGRKNIRGVGSKNGGTKEKRSVAGLDAQNSTVIFSGPD